MAQVSQTVANSQLIKGQKPIKLDKFIIDYDKATLPSRKQVDQKLRHIFG
jgi:hypothetical protein